MTVESQDKEHILIEVEPTDKMGKYVTWKKDNAMVKKWLMN
jgi:hypothetical protein